VGQEPILYTRLREVYQHQVHFTIIIISTNYAAKLWTSHERESVQARAFEESHGIHLAGPFRRHRRSGYPSDDKIHRLTHKITLSALRVDPLETRGIKTPNWAAETCNSRWVSRAKRRSGGAQGKLLEQGKGGIPFFDSR
jgi:hypothetical protein